MSQDNNAYYSSQQGSYPPFPPPQGSYPPPQGSYPPYSTSPGPFPSKQESFGRYPSEIGIYFLYFNMLALSSFAFCPLFNFFFFK